MKDFVMKEAGMLIESNDGIQEGLVILLVMIDRSRRKGVTGLLDRETRAN